MRPQNDITKENWKQLEHLNTDSLWIMDREDDRKLNYPGANIPNLQRQLFERYTKKWDKVFDPFLGSGTSLKVCAEMDRLCYGVDLHPYSFYKELLSNSELEYLSYIKGSILHENVVERLKSLAPYDFAFLHPPYWNIISYADKVGVDKEHDLSSLEHYDDFLSAMDYVLYLTKKLVKSNGYIALLIGDTYIGGKGLIPIAFEIMDIARSLMTLKSIIIKNMSANEVKAGGQARLWRQRHLMNGTNNFGHEYIFIFENC